MPYTFTTLAGLAGSSGSVDGTGSSARFNHPTGIAVDSSGNVFVADSGNHTIRKITAAGVVTTLAGLAGSTGSTDGTGSIARFGNPWGVAVDSSANVIVADSANRTIRKISGTGQVTTLAGMTGICGHADGTGSSASFCNPFGVAVDNYGNVFVADTANRRMRKITAAGMVTTLGGNGICGSADGTVETARFCTPFGVAADGSGNAFVADYINSNVRKITANGLVTTLAGLAGSPGNVDGTVETARFGSPQSVAVDGSGNVFVADGSIRKITAAGLVTTLAGLVGSNGSADGTGSSTRFNGPQGIAVDSSGNVYVADSANNTIRVGFPANSPVAPSITQHPQSQTVPVGGSATFSVTALGTPPLTYKWYFNNNPIPAATSASLTIANAGFPDFGNYFVVVGNAYGSTKTSTTAKLAINGVDTSIACYLMTVTPLPARQSGKNNLVVVTHGAQVGGPAIKWTTDLRDTISQKLVASGSSDWQVVHYDWTAQAGVGRPTILWDTLSTFNRATAFETPLANAEMIGTQIGRQIAAQGWSSVHLIGHSAGSGLIQAAADAIRTNAPAIIIQTTFLDPFLGADHRKLTKYGANADWSDNYFCIDQLTGSYTEGSLTHTYNVDASWLDPKKTPIYSSNSENGGSGSCVALSVHDWPHDFYSNSVVNALSACAASYGFGLSKEGGGWNNHAAYQIGNSAPIPCQNCVPLPSLAGVDPTRWNEVLNLPSLPDVTSLSGVELMGNYGINFASSSSQLPPQSNAKSGEIGPLENSVVSITNAPAWLSVGLTITNLVNFVQFDAAFTDTNSAQGLLTVYWDTNQIGTVDERVASPGLQTYRLFLPDTVTSNVFVLGFRLDAFNGTSSSLLVTNVTTGFLGMTQSIALNISLGTNGAPVLQLTAAPGYNYLVESSTNLLNWTPAALLVNTNGTVLFRDSSWTNSTARFYRALVP